MRAISMGLLGMLGVSCALFSVNTQAAIHHPVRVEQRRHVFRVVKNKRMWHPKKRSSNLAERVERHIKKWPHISLSRASVRCMAEDLFYEARGESRRAQIGFGYVVINRVLDARFPSTVCSVIHQRVGDLCQFSWYCDQKRIPISTDWTLYFKLKRLARDILAHSVANPVGNTVFYYIKPPLLYQHSSDAHVRHG